MKIIKSRVGVTLVTLSNASLFDTSDKRVVGGSERQMRYVADALISEKIPFMVLSSNVPPTGGNIDLEIELVNVWNQDDSIIKKIYLLYKAVKNSRNCLYLRGVSIANLAVVLFGKLSKKRITLGTTSDLHCAKTGAFWTDLERRLIFILSSNLLCQTKEQAELIKENFGCRSRVFRNVINPCRLGDLEILPKFNEREIDVIWIGNLDPRKGPERLIKIARASGSCRFVVIGGAIPGHEEFAKKIRVNINKLSNVSMLGAIQPQNIGRFLSKSKLLISTSQAIHSGLTKEGFPNIFLEAWHFGVPVISMNSNPDGLLNSNQLGKVCNTTEETTSYIAKIASNRKEWEKISLAAREYASTRDVRQSNVRKALISEIVG